VVVLISSFIGTAPDLPPGSGPIATLHFTIDGLLSETPNPITLLTVNGNVPEVKTQCFAYIPGAESGFVSLWTPPPPCCQGSPGNPNGIGGEEPTIGDISTIIDFLFINETPLTCLAEADINLSGGISPLPSDITIGDISSLIDHLFISLTPLPACP